MSNHFNIALVGFGNIGTGVVRHLNDHRVMLDSRVSIPIRLTWICDADLSRDRGVSTGDARLTSDYKEVLSDTSVRVVIELIGGTGIARTIVEAALRAGKHVVTANKALIATYGGELFDIADKHGVRLMFEASVGAGIPIIQSLQSGLAPDRVKSLLGIVNGTCNFILSSMEDQPGVPFDKVLREAMDAGYAEPDPTLDIEGNDTAHKLAILASLGFGRDLRADDVHLDGITRLAPEDMVWARLHKRSIKLLAGAELLPNGEPYLWVGPSMVPSEHLLGRTRGVLNGLWVDAEPIGPTFYYGAGAGQGSTSSGVLSDVLALARSGDHTGALAHVRIPREERQRRPPHGAIMPESYLRVHHRDAPRMLRTLGFDPLHEAADHATAVMAKRTVANHQETLGRLVAMGVETRSICVIRFVLQAAPQR